MKNKKILKSIIAFIFVFGLILSNLTNYFVKAVDAPPTNTNVVVHKLELPNLNGWPKKPEADGTIAGLKDPKYDGSEIANIQDYFGQGAKPLSGVEFSYWKITKEQYDYLKDHADNYKTVAKVEEFFGQENEDKTFNANGKGAESKATKKSAVTEGAQGTFEVELADGYYWFVENFGSKLDGDNTGKTLSKAAAVPFGLALPVYKADGNRFNTTDKLHVYPKNTLAENPRTDKNFEDGDINLDDNKRTTKNDKNVFVGQEVPYKVETEIPAGAEYKTAKWNDQMTEGLTFVDNSLVVTVGSETLTLNDHYSFSKDGNGFSVELNEKGLEKINNKTDKVTVTLKYKATVNDKAIVDIPEANDVTFHYGNNPSHGNTPKPNKPNPDTGEITVEKTWASGDFPAGVTATMQLFNAQTGEKVKEDIVLSVNNKTGSWGDLDKEIEYKVVEKWNGYTPEYKITNDGKTTVVNHKDDNPEPENPSEPKVVTGGKRFQKVDSISKNGLQGAEFYVTDKEGNQYLAKKDESQRVLEQSEYVAAEKAYKEAVKAGNPSDDLKIKRDNAYKVVNTQWKWIAKTEADNNRFVVISGEDGYFKITGLSYGEYSLVEKTAPTGYAKIKDPVPFVVKKDSNEVTNLNTNLLSDEGLKLIENKKITIPETGGMGTVIFTVVGALIMGSAVVAIRRRKTEEE